MANSPFLDQAIATGPSFAEQEREAIAAALQSILASTEFNKSQRSKRFLSYIVGSALTDEGDALKERTIGVEVFDRKADYSTAEDAIVRVHAVELRRRLLRFYDSPSGRRLVCLITLPNGSYLPHFEFRDPAQPPSAVLVSSTPAGSPAALVATDAPSATLIAPAADETAAAAALTAIPSDAHAGLDAHDDLGHPAALTTPETLPYNHGRPTRWLRFASLAAIALAALASYLPVSNALQSYLRHKTFLAFWGPGISAPQPIVIGMGRAITYRPTEHSFQQYAVANPGSFQREWQRVEQMPAAALPTTEAMKETEAYGVATGDAHAAARLTSVFSAMGKGTQILIGKECTYDALRQAPSILLGAFNNRWSFEFSSHLPFQFEDRGPLPFRIVEANGQHRVWVRMKETDGTGQDYGLIARLLDSQTGKFQVILGGIGTNGTEAATELVTNEDEFRSVAASLPSGWEKKNLAIVLKTETKDSIAGPPEMIAAQQW